MWYSYSFPGTRVSRIPVPMRTRTTSEPSSSDKEKRGLNRDTILKLVSGPRSRKDRKQITQMLSHYSKSHTARPKIQLVQQYCDAQAAEAQQPTPQAAVDGLAIEPAEEQELLQELPADVQLQLSALIADYELQQNTEANPIDVEQGSSRLPPGGAHADVLSRSQLAGATSEQVLGLSRDLFTPYTSRQPAERDYHDAARPAGNKSRGQKSSTDVISLTDSSESEPEKDCLIVCPKKVRRKRITSDTESSDNSLGLDGVTCTPRTRRTMKQSKYPVLKLDDIFKRNKDSLAILERTLSQRAAQDRVAADKGTMAVISNVMAYKAPPRSARRDGNSGSVDHSAPSDENLEAYILSSSRDAHDNDSDQSTDDDVIVSNIEASAAAPPKATRKKTKPKSPAVSAVTVDVSLNESARSMFNDSQNERDESLSCYMLNESVADARAPPTTTMAAARDAAIVPGDDRDVTLVQSMLSFTDQMTYTCEGEAADDDVVIAPIEIRPVSPPAAVVVQSGLQRDRHVFESVQYQQQRFETQHCAAQPAVEQTLASQSETESVRVRNNAVPSDHQKQNETELLPRTSSNAEEPNNSGDSSSSQHPDEGGGPCQDAHATSIHDVITITPMEHTTVRVPIESEMVTAGCEADRISQGHKRSRSPQKSSAELHNVDSVSSGGKNPESKRLRYDKEQPETSAPAPSGNDVMAVSHDAADAAAAEFPVPSVSDAGESSSIAQNKSNDDASTPATNVVGEIYDISMKEEQVRVCYCQHIGPLATT